MKKYKFLSLAAVLLLITTLLPVQALALEDPSVTARSVVLIDAASGDVLYQKNGDMTVNPGELTTLMTALLVAEAADGQSITLSEKVVASENFRYNLGEGAITADPAIVPGESLTVEELLYSSLLGSAADSCNILAERVGGTVESFIEAMNRRAAELGCTNTHFANANGQPATDGQTQQSTALDLARISQQLVTKRTILDVCRSTSYTIGATEVADTRTVTNWNYLVNPSSGFYYQQAYGLKAGNIAEIGPCLITAAEYNDVNVIAVILGCSENGDQFRDAVSLFDWAFGNYSYRQILNPYDTLATVEVAMGSPNTIGVRAETTISMLLPNDQQLGTVEYAIQYNSEQGGERLEAPINAGSSLGTVTVLVDGVDHGTTRLVAATGSDISKLDYLRTQLKTMIQTPAVQQIFRILLIVFIIYLLLVVLYLIQRMNHLRTMRRARKERARSRAHQEAKWLEVPQEELEGPAGYFDEPEYPQYDEEQPQQDNGYDDYEENFYDDIQPEEEDTFNRRGRHENTSRGPGDAVEADFEEDFS